MTPRHRSGFDLDETDRSSRRLVAVRRVGDDARASRLSRLDVVPALIGPTRDIGAPAGRDVRFAARRIGTVWRRMLSDALDRGVTAGPMRGAFDE